MHACRLKALLSQCPPTPEVFAAILSHMERPAMGSEALTLPAITKLLSKLNKRGQWQHGLALFWALPALGMQVRAPPSAHVRPSACRVAARMYGLTLAYVCFSFERNPGMVHSKCAFALSPMHDETLDHVLIGTDRRSHRCRGDRGCLPTAEHRRPHPQRCMHDGTKVRPNSARPENIAHRSTPQHTTARARDQRDSPPRPTFPTPEQAS